MTDAIAHDVPADAGEAAKPNWTADDALALTRSAAKFGLAPDLVGELRGRGLSVAAARDALIDAAAERDMRIETRSQRIEGGASYDDPASIRSRMVDALLHRAAPGAYELPDASREYRALSLADMKRSLLEARGVRTRGFSADEILTRSDLGGLHTTSDFPLLLADALHKELDRQVAAAASPLKALSRERTASDFRTMYVNRIGNASPLLQVNEAGEFKRGTWGEEREEFALATYGRIWGITRQVLINDDLGFFTDVSEEAALAVAELEASRFLALLVGTAGAGAVVSDAKAAFHADHGNRGTDGAPSVTTLSEARQLLRAQKGVGGLYLMGSSPKTLVVPPAIETTAETLIAALTPSASADVNPFAGKLALAVEPRLVDGERWYLFAEAPFFSHAYLEGNRGAQVATREGFDVDGVEIKVRHDFGVGIRDYRLAVLNDGAAPGG